MAITDVTRKILWGNSGSKCALCKQSLTMTSLETGQGTIVLGQECHIISKADRGPRSYLLESELPDNLDSAENLILLCPTDHELVDKVPDQYTVPVLRLAKITHETWVAGRLHSKGDARGTLHVVPRIRTGRDLFSILGSAMALLFEHAEPTTKGEAELIANLSQDVGDLIDVLSFSEAGDKVRMAFDFNDRIDELATAGFYIFGKLLGYVLGKEEASALQMPTAAVIVLKAGDPGVVCADDGECTAVFAMIPSQARL